MVLVLLRRQALRVRSDVDHHPIAQRIRSDPFYALYALPRFEGYYQSRGWDFPAVGALDWVRRQRRTGGMTSPTHNARSSAARVSHEV